jgi:hypothetical protein
MALSIANGRLTVSVIPHNIDVMTAVREAKQQVETLTNSLVGSIRFRRFVVDCLEQANTTIGRLRLVIRHMDERNDQTETEMGMNLESAESRLGW